MRPAAAQAAAAGGDGQPLPLPTRLEDEVLQRTASPLQENYIDFELADEVPPAANAAAPLPLPLLPAARREAAKAELPRFLEDVSQLLEFQRACRKEADHLWDSLELQGERLEANLAAMWVEEAHSARAGGGSSSSRSRSVNPVVNGIGAALPNGQRRPPLLAEIAGSSSNGDIFDQPPAQAHSVFLAAAVWEDASALQPPSNGALNGNSSVITLADEMNSRSKASSALLNGNSTHRVLVPVSRDDSAEEAHTGEEIGTETVTTLTASQPLSAHKLTELAQEEEEELQRTISKSKLEQAPKWIRVVRSTQFDVMVGLLIVANTAAMSLQLEYRGHILHEELETGCRGRTCGIHSEALDIGFDVLEQIFTAFFALELTVRLAANGIGYLKTIANALDAAVVLTSSVDAWRAFLPASNTEKTSNVAVLRLMRLAKLAKVLRVMRVMNAFKSLRVLVSAVAASVGALAWSMLLLFIFEIIGAIFLAQVLQAFIEDESEPMDTREWVWSRFGTWSHSMFTIFEITMSPGGFVQYRQLYDKVHPLFGVFLAIYVCLVTFAVVRVITAMFLKATLAASDHDEMTTVRSKIHDRIAYTRRLEKKVDVNGDGCLDKSELQRWLKTKRMQEWLEDVDLTESGIDRLFEALDRGDRQIYFSDFVDALVRMSTQQKARPELAGLTLKSDMDVVMLYHCRNMFNRLATMEKDWRVAADAFPWLLDAHAQYLCAGDGESSEGFKLPPRTASKQRERGRPTALELMLQPRSGRGDDTEVVTI
eukprot:TRINITY_DN90904_c0_g1_i1.p1 TRINITY_DN90904_c0_g1~~TRINITY_DN90904_c0_g1_i1.p1  ORF type:complete len:768 (-),score=190.65 TRINITY_DN90904_c0_g1_i1:151-2454(-)